MPAQLFSEQLLRRLERLELQSLRRVRSLLKGERRSRARGHSVEFADYRDYVPGDDLRYLDWNLYGRLDRLYIKLYEEERELPVWIFLDGSESMNFGEPSKFHFARTVAAAVGYVALCSQDRVSVSVFPADQQLLPLYHALQNVRGRHTAARFLEHMAQLQAGGRSQLSAVLRRAAIQIRLPGMALVISDFLAPDGWQDGLRALLGRRMDLTVIHVLSPEEERPTLAGDLRLVDSETGDIKEVTFGPYRMKAYRRMLEQFCSELENWCRRHGVRYLRCSSAEPITDLLLRRMVHSGIWR